MTLTRLPTNELADRNRLIYEYYRAYPEVTYKDIAQAFNISKQRVRYVIQRQFRNEAIKGKDILLKKSIKAYPEIGYEGLAQLFNLPEGQVHRVIEEQRQKKVVPMAYGVIR